LVKKLMNIVTFKEMDEVYYGGDIARY
jgi:hypothetical protein